MTNTCTICCVEYTKVQRKPLKCLSCEYEVCLECFCRWIEDKPNPYCMDCEKPIPLEYIEENTTTKYYQGFLSFRRDIEVEREKQRLPETMPFVKAGKIMVESEKQLKENYEKMAELKREMAKLKATNRTLEHNRDVCERMIKQGDLNAELVEEEHKNAFFKRKCPGEECQGFLSNKWVCGVCNKYVCKECVEFKDGREDPAHQCNPDAVETQKLLKKDTKPCPKCATPIFKIDGCDQMWCTQCHTAFSWRTGKEEHKVLHNPHYYEWMRQNKGTVPRNPGDTPGDTPCDNIREMVYIPQMKDKYRVWQSAHHLWGDVHLRWRQLEDLSTDIEDVLRLNRVSFIIGETDEKQWRKNIHNYHRKREKNQEFHQLLEMLDNALLDVWNTWYVNANQHFVRGAYQVPNELFNALRTQLNTLRSYFNDRVYTLNYRYNCHLPNINKNFLLSYY